MTLDDIPYSAKPAHPRFVYSFTAELEETRPKDPADFFGDWESRAIFYGYFDFDGAVKTERILKAWGLRFEIFWNDDAGKDHRIPTVYKSHFIRPKQ